MNNDIKDVMNTHVLLNRNSMLKKDEALKSGSYFPNTPKKIRSKSVKRWNSVKINKSKVA